MGRQIEGGRKGESQREKSDIKIVRRYNRMRELMWYLLKVPQLLYESGYSCYIGINLCFRVQYGRLGSWILLILRFRIQMTWHRIIIHQTSLVSFFTAWKIIRFGLNLETHGSFQCSQRPLARLLWHSSSNVLLLCLNFDVSLDLKL